MDNLGMEHRMATAAITHGVPVNLELGSAFVDLGAEVRDGQLVIVAAVDDGEGFASLVISPEQVELMCDVLRGLATIRTENK